MLWPEVVLVVGVVLVGTHPSFLLRMVAYEWLSSQLLNARRAHLISHPLFRT